MKGLLAALVLSLAAGSVAAQAEPVSGVWEGIYDCSQGPTHLRLTLVEQGKSRIKATFVFYPPKDVTRTEAGCFSMEGRLEQSGKLLLTQKRWIDRPNDYVMVDLDGWIDVLTNSFDGKVIGPGCTAFGVRRTAVLPKNSEPDCASPTS